MLVIAQLPFADVRPLLRHPTGRLDRPHWPDPISGNEFVREIGQIKDRRRGEVGGDWLGENAFCDASKLLRLRNQGHILNRPYTVVFRRLFSAGVPVRFDIALTRRGGASPTPSGMALKKISREFLETQVCVSGNPQTCQLGEAGSLLSRRLLKCTTQISFLGMNPLPLWWMAPGLPIILIEGVSNRINDNYIVVEGWQVEYRSRMIPVWAIEAGQQTDRNWARQLRGNLWRIHTEREALRHIFRAWSSHAASFEEPKLSDYLNDKLGWLAKKHRGGLDQASVLAVAQSCEELVPPPILDGLREQLKRRSLGILSKLNHLTERTEDATFKRISESARQDLIQLVHIGDTYMKSGDEWNVHANQIGGVGRENKIDFYAQSPAVEQSVIELLIRSIELKKNVPPEVAAEIDNIESDIRQNSHKEGAIKGAAERLREIAEAFGQIGAPVIRAVRDVMEALGS